MPPEAICEAVQRPSMRFVAIKSVEQQDIQAIHRLRSLVVGQRTALINQTRGLLLEFGLEVAQGRAALQRRLPEILEDAENGLSERFRAELRRLYEELQHLNERVTHYDAQIDQIAKDNAQAQALIQLPGVGAKGATALLAAVGEDPSLLKNGRGLAAWLGLVPRQQSTGGKDRLLGISKRGDVYRRQLLIHGARSVLRVAERKDDPLSCKGWEQQQWVTRACREKGRLVRVPERYCRSSTAMVPNVVCQQSFFYLPDATPRLAPARLRRIRSALVPSCATSLVRCVEPLQSPVARPRRHAPVCPPHPRQCRPAHARAA